MKRKMDGLRFSGAGLFFGAALFLALLAGVSAYAFLQSAVPSAQVLVMARDLPPGSEVGELDIAFLALPESAVPAGAVREKQAVIGKRLRYGLMAGDLIRGQHLVDQAFSEVPQKVTSLGDEYRAIMLPGDLVPATQRLAPGDRLELLGVLPVQDSIQNTSVAMPIGLATVLDIPKVDTDRGMVLVALRAEDVARLALAMRSGTLMVAVQGAGEPPAAIPSLLLESLTAEGIGSAQGASATPQAVQTGTQTGTQPQAAQTAPQPATNR